MSAATPAAAAEAPPAAKGGKKKLIIMIVGALLLVGLSVGVTAMLMKKKPAEGEEGEEGGDGHAQAEAHAEPVKQHVRDPKHPPVFVPLDPFTVNLADQEADRYAQVTVSLELTDAKVGEELKLYMPAIRNNILLLLSGKTSAQLLSRDGKERLAQAILYAAVQPLGYDVEIEEDEEDAAAAGEAPVKKKKKKKKKIPPNLPVVGVHFANIIVQ